jgi:hypothetical protein
MQNAHSDDYAQVGEALGTLPKDKTMFCKHPNAVVCRLREVSIKEVVDVGSPSSLSTFGNGVIAGVNPIF